MNSANLILSNRRFYCYVFPPMDFNGNSDIEILSDTVFYATCLMLARNVALAPSKQAIILQNLSKEKYTADSTQIPVSFSSALDGTNQGTPYFFWIPWGLEGGTILRSTINTVGNELAIGGYNK